MNPYKTKTKIKTKKKLKRKLKRTSKLKRKLKWKLKWNLKWNRKRKKRLKLWKQKSWKLHPSKMMNMKLNMLSRSDFVTLTQLKKTNRLNNCHRNNFKLLPA